MAYEDVEENKSSGLDSREWCLIQKSESSTDLYGELQITAERFKKLAEKLQKSAAGKDLTIEKGTQTNGCCEETKTKLMECIAENLRLRQSLKDVSDINHRWQDYNCDRQKHMQHLLSTVLELRRTIDEMKKQSIKPSIPHKKSERSEADNQFLSEIHQTTTTDHIKHQCRKSPIPLKESERNESDNQSASLNEKLSQEIRVLSRQLKVARNESKAQLQQLGKIVQENDTLRTLLKMYKSNWEDESRKKVEALSQAQRVVQDLCTLKVNCQLQAERLMKMSTVSFNFSLCQEIQNRDTLNNLNSGSHSECNAKAERKERHKRLTRIAPTIIQSIDSTEVLLQERCAGENTDKGKMNCNSNKITSENILNDFKNPIVTFPDSDSDEQTTSREESCVQLAISQHLICPVCTMSFLREHGSQFLDHYTKCKVSSGKLVS